MMEAAPEKRNAFKNILQSQQKWLTNILGLLIIVALILSLKVWLGGSFDDTRTRFQSQFDKTMFQLGLSIRHIEIIGVPDALAQTIKSNMMIDEGEPLLRASPHKLKARIERLPEVAGATIVRLWPDQLVIIAAPRRSIARYFEGQNYWLVDEDGEAFLQVPADYQADHMKIEGLGAPEAAPLLYQTLKAYPEIKTQLLSARRISERRWRLSLVSDIIIDLPVDHKMRAALGQALLWKAQIKTSGQHKIDLVNPENPIPSVTD